MMLAENNNVSINVHWNETSISQSKRTLVTLHCRSREPTFPVSA